MFNGVRFLNASGCWATDLVQVERLLKSDLDAVVTKTCTLYPREGNPGTTFFSRDGISVNCKGLPNEGYLYYKKICEDAITKWKKPIILSVLWENESGNTCALLKDYDDFIGSVGGEGDKGDQGVEGLGCVVELNLSCPNLHREIPSYSPSILADILEQVSRLELKNISISLKLSPYLDHGLCDRIIECINSAVARGRARARGGDQVFKYVVLSNSIPGCIMTDAGSGVVGRSVLTNVYGGLSGKLNKYISLGNVHYFRSRLSNAVQIIGCGGIECADDVVTYLDHGAAFVQLGSCFYDCESGDLRYEDLDRVIADFRSRGSWLG
jgi:dihydroorotate dehydrogenase (fumarate)